MIDNSPQNAADFTNAASGMVQRTIQDCWNLLILTLAHRSPTPPSGGRDNEDGETFAASVLTDIAANVTDTSRGRHVEVSNVSISKKRNRANIKKASRKAVAPAAGDEGATKKKRMRVSQTLEGFRKVTTTSVVASGHPRHLRENYGIDTGVETKIPVADETIDAPLVNPVAKGGDPMKRGYIPICWEFLNYSLRLHVSTFVNSVLTAIDRASQSVGQFAWATLTAFQVGCLSIKVMPSLNLFSRIFNVTHTGVLLHFHTRSQARNMLYHGKSEKASTGRWHKFWFLAKDAFSDEVFFHVPFPSNSYILLNGSNSVFLLFFSSPFKGERWEGHRSSPRSSSLPNAPGAPDLPHKVPSWNITEGSSRAPEGLAGWTSREKAELLKNYMLRTFVLGVHGTQPSSLFDRFSYHQIKATEVDYALSLRLNKASHRDDEVARLKAALAFAEKERDEALSK
ncbi:hypothetical protein LIER_12491 [Lithospermum erythrorhizon]|uniref:Uncharacterized protein n=1 Tax=Lithospermum erythrorhizon TaxID=34254 RepID=A0AAV3PTS9_LITER